MNWIEAKIRGIREGIIRCIRTGIAHGDRSTVHLSIDDVLALLGSSASGHAEIRKRVLPLQPENAARAGGTRGVWTANAHRNVIALGIARMPVEVPERALENEGMKFKPLVKKKRGCRHVRFSTRD